MSNYRPANYRDSSNSDNPSGNADHGPDTDGNGRSTNHGVKGGRRQSPPKTQNDTSPRAYRFDNEWADDDEPDKHADQTDQPASDELEQPADASSLWGESVDESPGLDGDGSTRSSRPAFSANAAWRATLSDLALQLPAANFDTWVRDARLIAYEDGEFLIGLPNAYARDWVENRLRNRIKRTLRSIVGREVDVTFRVLTLPSNGNADVNDMPLYAQEETTNKTATEQEETSPQSAKAQAAKKEPKDEYEQELSELVTEADDKVRKDPPSQSTRPGKSKKVTPYYSSQLNAHHTFKSFVVGNHNRLAHAAAEAVANQPGRSFNPLFIYGGVGLGKTHLLHAIGNLAQANGFHTLYCSSEQFTNELISAIRSQSTEEFRNKYRQVDILLIDDIQFIGGKESTQEEFFHTFNHLQASGGQVVLSSDRPPKALATLEERLRSRFEGGLQTDISQPDFETRVAILQSKATKRGVPIPQEVLMLVAERVDSNIRELEGALNQLAMQAQLSGSTLTHSLALSILDNLAPSRTPCSPPMVLEIVADHHGLSVEELKGRRRTGEIAGARQIAMFILRTENDMSLPAIGTLLGGRDHTTIRHGVAKIETMLKSDEVLKQMLAELRQKVYTPYIG